MKNVLEFGSTKTDVLVFFSLVPVSVKTDIKGFIFFFQPVVKIIISIRSKTIPFESQ